MTITLSAYTRTATNRSREDQFVPVGPRQTYLHANRFSKRGGRLRTRAWVPFDWQNEWGRVAFRFLGQCYHTGLDQCDNTHSTVLYARRYKCENTSHCNSCAILKFPFTPRVYVTTQSDCEVSSKTTAGDQQSAVRLGVVRVVWRIHLSFSF